MESKENPIANYIKGTVCKNIRTGKLFTCSGILEVDKDGTGLFDPENRNYVYMREFDEFAEIIEQAPFIN